MANDSSRADISGSNTFRGGDIESGTVDGVLQVINAKIETRAVNGTLAEALRGIQAQADKPEWVGYSVAESPGTARFAVETSTIAMVAAAPAGSKKKMASRPLIRKKTRRREPCNWSVVCATRRALPHRRQTSDAHSRSIGKIGTLDAGGLPIHLAHSAGRPRRSVALLVDFVDKATFEGHGEQEVAREVLSVIALHADPAADRAFESFVATDQPEQLRKHASFWLGAARGKSGELLLQKMAKSDPSPQVRSQVAFALSVSHEPEALNEMIRMAKDDQSTHVRGQALFWLAQKAGQKAMGAITGAIENDPDTEVKKKAVFALSQMPKDEGVPKLIEVAKSNRNPEVRKQAMFWLGQSNDPRALDFFEQVLSR